MAVDLERVSGRRFMSYLHAAFSGGAMAGAVGAGALLQAGVDYRLVYLALLLPLVSLVAAFAAARFPSPGFGGASGEWSHSDTSPAVDSAAKGSSGRWDLYRSGPLLLVAAITCLGLLAEGEMEHWSGIYLRDTLGLAAVAPVAFSVAGELVPERAGSAVSVVTTFGYGGFLLGSPLVGAWRRWQASGPPSASSRWRASPSSCSHYFFNNRRRTPRPKAASEPPDRRQAEATPCFPSRLPTSPHSGG